MRGLTMALAFAGAAVPTLAAEPPESDVGMYRAAPGKQTALLQWFAPQDGVAKAAGMPPGKLYVHKSGASWDFVYILPHATPAQDKALDAARTKMGLPVGAKLFLQLREMIAEHSDTITVGPMTAAEALAN